MNDQLPAAERADRGPDTIETIHDKHAAALFQYCWFLLQDTDAAQYTEIPTNQIPSAGTILPGRSVNGTYGFIIRKSDVGHLQAEVWAGQSEPHAIFVDGDGTT